MNRHPTNTKPHGGNRGEGIERKGNRAYLATVSALYGSRNASTHLPANWRERLPDPASYYAQHVAKLTKSNATGWAQGQCPFHEDRNASLSVHVASVKGQWRCFANCGGGDLVGFHMKLTGLDFKAAVRDLIGLEVRP
jgi:DNA primase (bacterial type)